MATVIHRTTAGAAHDKQVRQGSKPASPFKHIVLLTGTPITDIVAILAISSISGFSELHRFTHRSEDDSDFPITEEAATWTRFEPHLVESFVGHITAIAIVMDDGTVWGYAPYLPDSNGLVKSASFSWTLDLIIVESTEDASGLSFAYSPIDYRVMRDKLLLEIRDEIDISGMIAAGITAAIPGIITAVAAQIGSGTGGGTLNCATLVTMLSQITTFDVATGNLMFTCPDTPVDPEDPPPNPDDPTAALIVDYAANTIAYTDGVLDGVTLSYEYPDLTATAADPAKLALVDIDYPNLIVSN